MTPTLYTGGWFNGGSGQSSFSWSDDKLPTNANLLKFLQKGWNPLLPAPAPWVKQTMKTFRKKKRPQNPNPALFTGWGRVPSAVLQGFAHWTGPAKPCAHGSMQPAIVRFFIHAEVGFHVMCGDRLLVQRVGGLWGTEKHNKNIYAQGPTQGYFISAMGCPSLPSHIGPVSVHSGSVKTLSSRERWWPISRQPAVPLPPGGYCPPLPAEPSGHLSQCHTLKNTKVHFSQLTINDNNPGRGESGGSVSWGNVGANTVPLRRALFSVTHGTQQVAFIAFWAKWGDSARVQILLQTLGRSELSTAAFVSPDQTCCSVHVYSKSTWRGITFVNGLSLEHKHNAAVQVWSAKSWTFPAMHILEPYLGGKSLFKIKPRPPTGKSMWRETQAANLALWELWGWTVRWCARNMWTSSRSCYQSCRGKAQRWGHPFL